MCTADIFETEFIKWAHLSSKCKIFDNGLATQYTQYSRFTNNVKMIPTFLYLGIRVRDSHVFVKYYPAWTYNWG